VLIRTALPLEAQDLAHGMREVLTGLARAFAFGLRRRPLPPLYSSGVRYAPEPGLGSGEEEWADPWTVARRGWGDCDDLVAWRVAELLLAGEAAGVNCIWTGQRYHVRVRRANGSLEDPSLQLMTD
jgi:hypothetical protein